MNTEQYQKILEFAAHLSVDGHHLVIEYGEDCFWRAVVEAGDDTEVVELTMPSGGSWPDLDTLLRMLTVSGIGTANIRFARVMPIYEAPRRAAATDLETY